jgi:molybdate transport system substrate-binding protein
VSKGRIIVVVGAVLLLAALNLLILQVPIPGLDGALRGFRLTGDDNSQPPPPKDEALVAAASDLNPALKEIAGAFEQETGKRIRITFGASGTLFAQIRNGAPFDVFLSANTDYAQRLIDQGWAEPELLAHYAEGRLVLWTRKDSGIDVRSLGLQAVADPRVQKVAIANPVHAPYGIAAEAALRSAHLYDAAARKLVIGENVAQTAQFAHSGNADLAVVALSVALAPEMQQNGVYFVIPQHLYPPLRQAAVLMKGRWRNVPATRFLSFLRSEKARVILTRYGFTVPDLPR